MTTGPAPITGKDWQNHVEPRIMAEDLRALEQGIKQALDGGGVDVGQAVEDYLTANPPVLGGGGSVVGIGGPLAVIGDSNVERFNWPTTVGGLVGATAVYKIGVGGTRLSTHNDPNYDKFSGSLMAEAIASGDWTAQDAAADVLKTSYNDDNTAQLALAKSVDWSTVKWLVVSYGGNDFNGPAQLGTPSDRTRATVYGSVHHIVSTLGAAYPHMRILFTTPTYRQNALTPNSAGFTLPEVCDAISLAAHDALTPAVNAYRTSGVNPSNVTTFMREDMAHMTPAGVTRYATLVAQALPYPSVTTPTPGTTTTTTTQAGGSVIAYDSFDREDGPLGTADSGQAWITEGTLPLGIVSGGVIKATTSGGNGYATIDVGSADHSVTVRVLSADVTIRGGLVRFVDQTNFYHMNIGSGTVRPMRNADAPGTSASLTSARAIAAGDLITMSAKEEEGGTRIRLAINGVEVWDTLDSTEGRPAGTKVGVSSAVQSTPTIDDFSASLL